jgi:hypothetical protein
VGTRRADGQAETEGGLTVALRILHLGSAVLLLASHCLFFVRGLRIDRGAFAPGRLDRVARSLAQALLPVTALTGALRLAASGAPFVPHGLVGLLPVAAIPLVFFVRLALRRRRPVAWLLPAVNLVLIIGAMATGFAAALGAAH